MQTACTNAAARRRWGRRVVGGLLACALLASCAPLHKSPVDPGALVAANLRTADRDQSLNPTPAKKAELDQATFAVAEWAVTHQVPPVASKRFSAGSTTYELEIPKTSGRGQFATSSFTSLTPASRVPRTLVRTWEARPGVGVPLAAKWQRPTNPRFSRFVSPEGYLMPVTTWLHFPQDNKTSATRKARLEFLDPTTQQEVEWRGRKVPLAADFSAPLVERTRNIREAMIALANLLHPDVQDAQLYMLQPYDPDRIPVVLVHGLLSHPRMWRDVLNELLADPKISARYQFWVYFYPTGWPITYSAMRLREDLKAVDKAVGHSKRVVLIGHSMGGLICRLQAVSPGDLLVRTVVAPDRMAAYKKLPPEHIAHRMLEFQANPAVERIIFISTPHRGSSVADWSVATWFTKFLSLPKKLTEVAIDLVPSAAKTPWQYTSISRLSPSNPLYRNLETLPIQTPHHSIIGDRGRGDTPNSSDGVVAYWSSHLDTAESEVIVPDDHGAFDDPAAIAEIRRILLKNLNTEKSRESGPSARQSRRLQGR